MKFCIWLFFEYARSYNSIPFIWENFETSPYGKLRHSWPPQSQVRSHFLWSVITHNHFSILWFMITHDHFVKILKLVITIMIGNHFANHAHLKFKDVEGFLQERIVIIILLHFSMIKKSHFYSSGKTKNRFIEEQDKESRKKY